MSYYVELDIPDELFERLEELSEEEGLSIEDLIMDVLQDEVSLEGDDMIEEEEEVEEEELEVEDYDN